MTGVRPGKRESSVRCLAVLCAALVVSSCGGSVSPTADTPPPVKKPPPPPAALTITATALPAGVVGQAYSASLTATGGTAPLSWSLVSGTLPAGLALAAATGAISGTPTASVDATPLTFRVTDSSKPPQTQSVTLPLTINPASLAVSVTPTQAAVTVSQPLTLTATTNDFAGVSWSSSPAGGSFSATTSASGTNVTFTAPPAAGLYTVTASSVTNPKVSAAMTVAVTDLVGVYTTRNDLARDGVNDSEFALTTATVNTSTFGKLFSCTVDGAIYAQPLWVANLNIAGAQHNVVFVATAHDSLFAFDADASPCQKLWQVSLIDAAHGATAGETTVPAGLTGYYVGDGYGNISPEVGVIGTPVIDPASATLYVVSKSMSPGPGLSSPSSTTFYQRLHAINIATGGEKAGSPVVVGAGTVYPGKGSGQSSVAFSPRQENQRAGLALLNGTVYVGWSSHEDAGVWWGWIMGYTYSGTGWSQSAVLNTAPNVAHGAGVWMSGGAPPADGNGNLYVLTGNGTNDASSSSAPNNDYGDSFLQLSPALNVKQWFAPSNQAYEGIANLDLGSGGAALVLNLATGPLQHLVVGGGKDGVLFVINGDAMGGFDSTDANAWQHWSVGGALFSTAAFWNNSLYIAPAGMHLLAYAFDATTDMFTPIAGPTPSSQSPTPYGFPGSSPAVSASGTSNGIVWSLDDSQFCTGKDPTPPCGPAVLHAYDATNLATELWNSSMVAADAAGYAVKFTVPTVANGKVYVGTRGNNQGGVDTSTSVPGELDVYGLKP
jgi:hypothetical protein